MGKTTTVMGCENSLYDINIKMIINYIFNEIKEKPSFGERSRLG